MTQTQTVRSSFEEILKRFPKVYGVMASDKDGLILCKVVSEVKQKNFDNNLSPTFFSATEQASKLQMGSNRCTVTVYNNLLVLHSLVASPATSNSVAAAGPGPGPGGPGWAAQQAASNTAGGSGLLLTLIADINSNYAQLVNVISDLKLKIDPLRDKFSH